MSTPCSQISPEQRERLKDIVLPLIDDLHRVAVQLSGSHTEAEELVAESVANACQNFSSLRDSSKAKQWLMRILTNTFLSRRRERTRHGKVPYNEQSDPEDNSFSLYDQVVSPFLFWGNPERDLINKLLDEDIHKALTALPEEFRVVVVLCLVEGYSYEEIARTLDIPVGTVRSRLSRGRSLLQRSLFDHAQERGLVRKSKAVVNQENIP